MGIFDYVELQEEFLCETCGVPLSGWQTKDSPAQFLQNYQVQPDKTILEEGSRFLGRATRVLPSDFCGCWELATSCDVCRKSDNYKLILLQLVIIDGKVFRLHRL